MVVRTNGVKCEVVGSSTSESSIGERNQRRKEIGPRKATGGKRKTVSGGIRVRVPITSQKIVRGESCPTGQASEETVALSGVSGSINVGNGKDLPLIAEG
jgi:hypothetical protein